MSTSVPGSRGPFSRDRGGHVVELYVRSLTPENCRGYQDEAIDRLDALSGAGTLEAADVIVAGRCVCPENAGARTPIGRFLLDRLAAFRTWAVETGCSIDPFFVSRSGESAFTGDIYTGTTFPTMALAEFRDNDLAFVAPCTDGTRTYTVFDRLDAISNDREENTMGVLDPSVRLDETSNPLQ